MTYGSVPRDEVTKTPRLDPVIKIFATQGAKAANKELAKLQTFVLDSLAPLTTLLVYSDGMLVEKVKEVSSTTVELRRSANAQISCLRREKLVTSINMNLAPLVQVDAPHNLFGPEFSKGVFGSD